MELGGSELVLFDSWRFLFRFNRLRRYRKPATSAAKRARIPSKNPVMKANPANETISGKVQSVFISTLVKRKRGEDCLLRNQEEKKMKRNGVVHVYFRR